MNWEERGEVEKRYENVNLTNTARNISKIQEYGVDVIHNVPHVVMWGNIFLSSTYFSPKYIRNIIVYSLLTSEMNEVKYNNSNSNKNSIIQQKNTYRFTILNDSQGLISNSFQHPICGPYCLTYKELSLFTRRPIRPHSV